MASAADLKKLGSMVREEDLEELQGLLGELREKAGKSSDDGRIFMMQQYVRLIALVQPEVTRIQIRFSRESLAGFRKELKALKPNKEDEDET